MIKTRLVEMRGGQNTRCSKYMACAHRLARPPGVPCALPLCALVCVRACMRARVLPRKAAECALPLFSQALCHFAPAGGTRSYPDCELK